MQNDVDHCSLLITPTDQSRIREFISKTLSQTIMAQRQWQMLMLVLATTVALTLPVAADIRCDTLKANEARTGQEIIELLKENPGTHLALGSCIAGAAIVFKETQDKVKAGATFLGCGFISCGIVGSDNCWDVGRRWMGLLMSKAELERQKQQIGCGP